MIIYTEDGGQEVVELGNRADALRYEIRDMENAVAGKTNEMRLDYSCDVMRIMTELRRGWGVSYPEEK